MHFKTKLKTVYQIEAGPKDRYLLMFKGQEKESLPVIEWVIKTLVRDDRCMWFLKAYKTDPKIWTDKTKTDLDHFMSMRNLVEIEKLKFEPKWNFKEGVKELEKAEKEGLARFKDKNPTVPKSGEKIVDLGNGWAWWNTGKPSCRLEGDAMGHCGNTAATDRNDELLSLREDKKIGKNTFYTPYLTFILNDGVLGEMKGRANEKPKQKYHKAIIKLLESPHVKHLWGGGHEAHRNFEVEDLTDAEQEHLFKLKPALNLKSHLGEVNLAHHPKHGDEIRRHNEDIHTLRRAANSKPSAEDDDIDDIMDGKEAPELTQEGVEKLVDSTDPEVKAAAVRKSKDQKKLVSLVEDKDEKYNLRMYAAPRVTDQKEINRLVLDVSIEEDLRKLLIVKVRDQETFQEIVKDNRQPDRFREAATEQIKDQAWLKEFALTTASGAEIVVRHIKDQKMLGDIAKEAKDVDVRLAAAEAITDDEVAADVVKHNPEDTWTVNILAKHVKDQSLLEKIAPVLNHDEGLGNVTNDTAVKILEDQEKNKDKYPSFNHRLFSSLVQKITTVADVRRLLNKAYIAGDKERVIELLNSTLAKLTDNDLEPFLNDTEIRLVNTVIRRVSPELATKVFHQTQHDQVKDYVVQQLTLDDSFVLKDFEILKRLFSTTKRSHRWLRGLDNLAATKDAHNPDILIPLIGNNHADSSTELRALELLPYKGHEDLFKNLLKSGFMNLILSGNFIKDEEFIKEYILEQLADSPDSRVRLALESALPHIKDQEFLKKLFKGNELQRNKILLALDKDSIAELAKDADKDDIRSLLHSGKYPEDELEEMFNRGDLRESQRLILNNVHDERLIKKVWHLLDKEARAAAVRKITDEDFLADIIEDDMSSLSLLLNAVEELPENEKSAKLAASLLKDIDRNTRTQPWQHALAEYLTDQDILKKLYVLPGFNRSAVNITDEDFLKERYEKKSDSYLLRQMKDKEWLKKQVLENDEVENKYTLILKLVKLKGRKELEDIVQESKNSDDRESASAGLEMLDKKEGSFKDSWGANWGEKGYMRIVYKSSSGRNCNGIGNVAAYAILDGITNVREHIGLP